MYIYTYTYIVLRSDAPREDAVHGPAGHEHPREGLEDQQGGLRTVLDLPKPKYCGAPNLCEDLY